MTAPGRSYEGEEAAPAKAANKSAVEVALADLERRLVREGVPVLHALPIQALLSLPRKELPLRRQGAPTS